MKLPDAMRQGAEVTLALAAVGVLAGIAVRVVYGIWHPAGIVLAILLIGAALGAYVWFIDWLIETEGGKRER